MEPKFTRDGRPVRVGRGVMPGPDDTYIGYAAGWANASNTPFRMYKHWIHEGGIATPLVVHWPKGIAAKSELRHQPGHLIDIMATCVEVARAKYPRKKDGYEIHPMQGTSLVPSFANGDLDRDTLCWEHEGNRAIRVGKWKLVSRPDEKPRNWDTIDELPLDLWKLYDLEEDRTELNNLAARYPDRVRQMAAMWSDWARRVKAVPKPSRKSAQKRPNVPFIIADDMNDYGFYSTDPREFSNIAQKSGSQPVIQRLRKWFPDQWAGSLGGRKG
jgi:arylsulfatase